MGENYLNKLEEFLNGVNLRGYRLKYSPIKIVEMDLPKDIQAIDLLYKVYWDRKKFICFENFYKEYLDNYQTVIENFRQKITMCKDCFYRGLPARIYRTWASLITQIHAGYVAESVYGGGTVSMSADLDHAGADFQVNYKSKILNYQVKKKSFSREVRQQKEAKKKIKGHFITINYEVPSEDYFKNPKKKDGNYKLPYLRFIKNKGLKRFTNGFVVFTRSIFEEEKNKIDASFKKA